MPPRVDDKGGTMSDQSKEQLATQVDETIRKFDEWFQKEHKQEPLTRSEKAILRTYLIYSAKSQ